MNIFDLIQTHNLSDLKQIAAHPEPFHVEQFGIDTLNDLSEIFADLGLINKLGGYQSAKSVYKSMAAIYPGFDLKNSQYSEIEFIAGNDQISLAQLQQSLLNYRRYYGTYEPGDFILYESEIIQYPPPDESILFRHATKAELSTAQPYQAQQVQ